MKNNKLFKKKKRKKNKKYTRKSGEKYLKLKLIDEYVAFGFGMFGLISGSPFSWPLIHELRFYLLWLLELGTELQNGI